NVANNSRRAIHAIIQQSQRFNVDRVARNTKQSLEKLPKTVPVEVEQPALRSYPLSVLSLLPVDVGALGDLIQQHHRVPSDLVNAWKQVALPLLRAYSNAVLVAEKRSAHVQAYEAAVTTLYRRYLEVLEAHPERLVAGSRPQADALALARLHCGLPAPPRADLRFRVEAFWASMSIRLLLVDLAVGMKKHIPTTSEGTAEAWMDFVAFIIRSVENDAKIAIRVAEGSQSHKQVLKTQVFLLEAQYMAVEHAVECHGEGAPQAAVEELKTRTSDGSALAKATVIEAGRKFGDAMQHPDAQEWANQNFVQPANAIVQKWEDLARRLARGVFYSDVTTDEKKSILRALMGGGMGFSIFVALMIYGDKTTDFCISRCARPLLPMSEWARVCYHRVWRRGDAIEMPGMWSGDRRQWLYAQQWQHGGKRFGGLSEPGLEDSSFP
ncbi:hypothetical protein FRB93_005370, partial [Tulasnella sp. JGI-2019a]